MASSALCRKIRTYSTEAARPIPDYNLVLKPWQQTLLSQVRNQISTDNET